MPIAGEAHCIYMDLYVSVGAADGLESPEGTRTETARVDALEKIRPKSWNLSKKTCNLPRA